MTNPYVLHATAALWSLAQAWPLLLSAREHALAAGGSIQAWRPTTIVTGGAGPSSRPPGNIVSGEAQHLDRLYEDGLWSLEQGRYLIVNAGLPKPATWLEYADRIQVLPCRAAMDVKLWLGSTDETIRRALGMAPDLWTLPSNPPCPWCGVRLLRVQKAAPDSRVWTVVCTAGCRCRGAGCGCGMLEPLEGVGHIWDRTAPFLEPTTPNLVSA